MGSRNSGITGVHDLSAGGGAASGYGGGGSLHESDGTVYALAGSRACGSGRGPGHSSGGAVAASVSIRCRRPWRRMYPDRGDALQDGGWACARGAQHCHDYEGRFGTLLALLVDVTEGTMEACLGSPVTQEWFEVDFHAPARQETVEIPYENETMPEDFWV